MLLGDRELRMPAFMEPVMAQMLERGRIRVGEMGLDAESRMVLVRRLIKEGLLEVVGSTADRFRCSTEARDREEPLFATASTVAAGPPSNSPGHGVPRQCWRAGFPSM